MCRCCRRRPTRRSPPGPRCWPWTATNGSPPTVVAADQTRQPGVVVLVGGGDPILSAAPPGEETWYRGAARISDLVDQVRKSGVTATAVQVDDSLFSGPDFAPGWDPADIDGGDIAPIQSVMIDAGRIQPTTVDSAAVQDPGAGRRTRAGHARWASTRPRSRSPRIRRRDAAAGLGAVGAADRAAAADDERLRQRDGRVHRPRGGQGDRPSAELRRRRRRGDQQTRRRRRRHDRRHPVRLQRACRSWTG